MHWLIVLSPPRLRWVEFPLCSSHSEGISQQRLRCAPSKLLSDERKKASVEEPLPPLFQLMKVLRSLIGARGVSLFCEWTAKLFFYPSWSCTVRNSIEADGGACSLLLHFICSPDHLCLSSVSADKYTSPPTSLEVSSSSASCTLWNHQRGLSSCSLSHFNHMCPKFSSFSSQP